MPYQPGDEHPALVTMPAEIDMTSQDRVGGLLDEAFARGARVVVADLTATAFCDCAGMRGLLAAGRRAAVRGVQFRLAIPYGTAVRRLADLLAVDRLVPVYHGLREAAGVQAAGVASGPPAPAGRRP